MINNLKNNNCSCNNNFNNNVVKKILLQIKKESMKTCWFLIIFWRSRISSSTLKKRNFKFKIISPSNNFNNNANLNLMSNLKRYRISKIKIIQTFLPRRLIMPILFNNNIIIIKLIIIIIMNNLSKII
jgi:hypothetical protein